MTKPEAIKGKEYSSVRRVQDQYKTLPLVDAAIESFLEFRCWLFSHVL